MSRPVVVVGASGAGLFCAYQLARAGLPVELYDQAEQLNPRARTLIVTSDLSQVLGFAPTSAVINRVQRFEFQSAGTLAKLELRDPDLIVERAELIRLLAAQATWAGVRIHHGHRFQGFELDGPETRLVFGRLGTDRLARIAARAVVGADGAGSAVARALGQPERPTTTVIQARVALPSGADPHRARVWFAPRETPYFYWLVPESAELAAVGLVDADRKAARAKLDRFLRAQNYQPLEYQAARIPMYEPSPAPHGRIGRTSVYLVGDAGGQVKVTTVGGTVSGLTGARAAAQAIRRERAYHHELWPLHRELTVHWIIRGFWNRFGEDEYVALLRSLNERVRAILQARSRDRWSGAVWPVLTARPALLALAARTAA